MIAGLDSSFSRPTSVIAAQARAAGIGLWSGYLATRSGVNLASPWDLASFDVARQVGGTPIAFCSGWDDPVACRNLATQWNVRLCLDVETGIRGDGPWVQPFLDLSGAGLYGQHYQDTSGVWHSIHLDRTAAFHVMSWYIGRDPGTNWVGPQPADGAPLGWQWEGDHQEFGLSVDRGTYADWFGDDLMPLDQPTFDALLTGNPDFQRLIWRMDAVLHDRPLVLGGPSQGEGNELQSAVAKLSAPPAVDVNALAAALATHPVTASLSDAEREAIAQHVAAHFVVKP